MVILRVILLLISVICSFSTVAMVNCPKGEAEKLQLADRQNELQGQLEGLVALTEGRLVVSGAFQNLFKVNLEDPSKVTKRVDELQLFLQQEKIAPVCQDKESSELLGSIYQTEAEVARLKLKFLSLPLEQRAALVNLQKEATRSQAELDTLKQTNATAEQTIEQASEAIKTAEKISKDADSLVVKQLSSEIASVERFRKDLAEETTLVTTKMKQANSAYQKVTEELAQVSSVLSKKDAPVFEITEAYERVALRWRSIVDAVVTHHVDLNQELFQKLPDYKADLSTIKDSEIQLLVDKYKSAYQLAQAELENLTNLKKQWAEQTHNQRYRDLVLTGQIRSQMIRMLEQKGAEELFKISNQYFEDLLREIQLVPYRPRALLFAGYEKLKSEASRGIEGIIEIFRTSMVLLLFFIIPAVAFLFLRKFLNGIEQARVQMLRNRKMANSLRFTRWMLALKPYLPWIVMLLAFYFSEGIVSGTEIYWLSDFIPYFKYYFIYRLFRVAIDNNLTTINRMTQGRLSLDLPKRIETTSKYLGLYFLISAYLLEATAAVARRALLFGLISDFMLFLTPVVLAIATFYWRDEIHLALKQAISAKSYSKISKYFGGSLDLVLSLPAFLFLIFIILFKKLKSELEELDSVKSLSAQLFRKRLELNREEAAEARNTKELPEAYRELYQSGANVELVFDPDKKMNAVETHIEDWLQGKSEIRSIAIVGNSGIGKTTFIKGLEPNCRTVKAKIENKIIDSAGLFGFLSRECGIDLSESEDISEQIHKIDTEATEKVVIFIDDIHNLFLSHRKGFEAYRTFISILSVRTQNIFWCVTANSFSWKYLDAVGNGSQVFRKVIRLQAWEDDQIKALITHRNYHFKYDLEFDSIIYSLNSLSGAESFAYVEDRFFELLWEQSKGNPRTAMTLWISALSMVNDRKLKVGLPTAPLSHKIEGLNEDELFVIASIVRHESLNTKQATLVTGIDEAVVQHAVRVAVERGYLVRSVTGFYRVSSLWQPMIYRDLLGKNLVYG